MRVVMIHAVAESIPQVRLAFKEVIPQVDLVNLLDEGLLLDFGSQLTPRLRRRMSQIICYCAEHGADADQHKPHYSIWGILTPCRKGRPGSDRGSPERQPQRPTGHLPKAAQR